MPALPRPSHRCTECGLSVAKWVGRCPQCQAWGSVSDVTLPAPASRRGAVTAPAQRIAEVDVEAATARPTGVGELDRVLGGGLVPGAVILLAGEPGVGKSTLTLEIAAKAARAGSTTLYLTGEESAAQVRLRAGRTGALEERLWLAAETDLGAALSHLDAVAPTLLVVDSIQTIASAAADGSAGGVTQIRAVTAGIIAVAKARGIATVLVGHVTKDGSIAGPRLLEHLVDVVLAFEGDRHSSLRMVRAVKNRFGPADEVGCFTLDDGGIIELPDPSGLFLTRRRIPVPGTCVSVTIEGRRPMPAEVQALVEATEASNPRRAVSGLDSNRVAMILAVLGGHQTPLGRADVFASTIGGVRLGEPANDLAVALAVWSARHNHRLPADMVAIGEVSLSGDVRRVPGVARRLVEAARLGFTRALVPPESGSAPPGMRVIEVADLDSALTAVRDGVLGRAAGLRPVTLRSVGDATH